MSKTPAIAHGYIAYIPLTLILYGNTASYNRSEVTILICKCGSNNDLVLIYWPLPNLFCIWNVISLYGISVLIWSDGVSIRDRQGMKSMVAESLRCVMRGVFGKYYLSYKFRNSRLQVDGSLLYIITLFPPWYRQHIVFTLFDLWAQ